MLKHILLLLLLLTLTPLQAAVHRWVDDNGNVHYSDQPPAKQASEKIEIKPHTPDPATQERLLRHKQTVESSQEAREEQKEQQQAEAKEAEQQKERCKQARAQLNLAETTGRIYETDENGERKYMDDKQREAYLEQAREAVKKFCQ